MTLSDEISNIEILPQWTQSDELAANVKYLQEARTRIKCALEKWALDTEEKKRAHRIIQKLHDNTCEAIADIDALREKTKPVKCEHSVTIGKKCQDCGKTLYREPPLAKKGDSD